MRILSEYPNFNFVGEEWNAKPDHSFLLAEKIAKALFLVIFLLFQVSDGFYAQSAIVRSQRKGELEQWYWKYL